MSDESSSTPPEDADTIARAALGLSGKERADYLEKACGDDSDLRWQVEVLLIEEEKASGVLGGESTIADSKFLADGPGAAIGAYTLGEAIGAGSMAKVYRAHQSHPVHREVAIKIIRPVLDSGEFLTRFESERQGLAPLSHPGIASQYECGTTRDGKAFVAMEIVNGQPITEYCDTRKFTVRERLELFIDVCAAMRQAHLRGIIHRNLKPSNIFAVDVNGAALPKIVDFGIAWALEQKLSADNLYTLHGSLLVTPQYMSPELVSGGAADADMRSDIYSLGVVLYELLVGETPFALEKMRGAGIEEIERVVREDRAATPSDHLGALGEKAGPVALARQATVAELSRTLRGDLDAVVLKAIEKQPGNRYESVTDFGTDLERVLNGEPAAAAPSSAGYRAKSFVRRHHAVLRKAAVCTIGGIIVLGIVLNQVRLELEMKGYLGGFGIFLIVLSGIGVIAGLGSGVFYLLNSESRKRHDAIRSRMATAYTQEPDPVAENSAAAVPPPPNPLPRSRRTPGPVVQPAPKAESPPPMETPSPVETPAPGEPPALEPKPSTLPQTELKLGQFCVLADGKGNPCVIGEGPRGKTYKAFDPVLDRIVAVKLIRSDLIRDESARRRLMREAKAVATLEHPNVGSIFDCGEDGDSIFYAMEYIEGRTLSEVVADRGPLPAEEALEMARQVAEVLEVAENKHLVHRNIKPSKILLDESGKNPRPTVKMIDFGIARELGPGLGDDLTLTNGGFVGTPIFASPEQLEEMELDVRSDIYSLGVTLWYLLKGKPPFQATGLANVIKAHLLMPPPFEELESHPAAIRNLLARMLEKNPDDRYAGASALHEAIVATIRQLPAPAVPQPE